MRPARSELKLVLSLVMFGAAGCNALLGNGYGVDDTAGEMLDGSSSGDPLAEGGGGVDGGTGPDGTTVSDGAVVTDATLDGSACPDGGCPAIKLTNVIGPQRIALSTASLAWASLAGIGRVGLDGTNPETKAIAGLIAMGLKRGVAVDTAGTTVYMTMPDALGRGAGKCVGPLAACTLETFIGSAGAASSMALDGTTLHVGIFASGGAYEVKGGSASAYFMNDKVLDLQVVGGKTFFRTATEIRFVAPPTDTTSSASAATLNGLTPLAFVVSGTTLFVGASNGIHSCNGLPCTVAPSTVTANAVSAVTADATDIYWVEGTGGTVHRCARTACDTTKTTLATGQLMPNDIAVDGTAVYWANYGNATTGAGGSIMRLQKGP